MRLRRRPLTVLTLGVAALVTTAVGRGQAAGQAAPPNRAPAPATAVLGGRVVEADGKTPIPGAIVRLTGGGLGSAGGMLAAATGSGPRAMETNAAGQFLFTDLPKGSYNLNATAAGFLAGQYGQDRPRSPIPRALDIVRTVDLVDGEFKTDANVRLWRLGVITGTVVDEYGQPVVGVDVHVTAVSEIWIGRISSNVESATTDDRGIYRAEVAPGDYIVAVGAAITTVPSQVVDDYAQASSQATSMSALLDQFSGLPAPPPAGLRVDGLVAGTSFQSRPLPWLWTNAGGPVFVYPATYYPSAPLSTMASVINVPAGVERGGIDLQLKPQPAFRISGRVVGPSGPMGGLTVRLIGADFNTKTNSPSLFTPTAATDVNGNFTFLGVTSGQYTVDAFKNPAGIRQGTSVTVSTGNGGAIMGMSSGPGEPSMQEPVLWVSQSVTVGAGDVSGVSLVMTEGPRISGRFEFAPASLPLTPEQIRAITVGVRVLPGTVAGRLFPNPNLGTATDDGVSFHTSSLVPGTYILTANRLPNGWVLKSAMTGGKDAADAPIDIGPGGVTDLVMTFTNKTANLTGTVTTDDAPPTPGSPAPRPTVVIFSTDQGLWPKVALSPRTLRSVPAAVGQTYRAAGMPPGEYFVAASSSAADFTDPQVLLFLSKTAARVTLVEGESRSQDVHAVVVPAVR